MRILCDRNVAKRYLDAFQRTDWIRMIRVEDVLPKDALDREIAAYAEEHDWVVFTSDKRFRTKDAAGHESGGQIAADFGVVYYHQREQPSPMDVVHALRAIADAYVDHSEIEQYVPGEWIWRFSVLSY